MNDDQFPALYRSANRLSLTSQANFLLALRVHLVMLVVAAILSIVGIPHWSVAAIQLLVLLAALFCSIYLFSKRPDRYWYAGRAVAESVKTITWRFVSRAEPFDDADEIARSCFREKIKAIVDQNRDVAQMLTENLVDVQITSAMTDFRAQSLEGRKEAYATGRISDQLIWYAKKAALNRRASNQFFAVLISINVLAVIFATLRMKFVDAPYWPTDVFVAGAASLLSWMQAKRFSELAASYALAAHEISIVRERARLPSTESQFSEFVGDAENAFSREHTQWVARRDA